MFAYVESAVGSYRPRMATINWDGFPLVQQQDLAWRWLHFIANLGRAPNTVNAYGRAVEDFLRFCVVSGANPVMAHADVVADWIGEMHARRLAHVTAAGRRAGGFGLANATVQQRVVALRSFFDYVVEDGVRDRNPVRRGRSGRVGGRARRGLVGRVQSAPWIPNDEAWQLLLAVAARQSLRNRLMVAFAYDGALRREELVQLDVDDLEPAYGLIHLRAETTKSKRARTVAFGSASSRLLVAYLRERRVLFGRVDGALFRSVSNRNYGRPLGVSSWSKIVEQFAGTAGLTRFSTHTFRHLRLTDLARAEWTVDQIAQYAGHRDLATTMTYIHLSGRELAERFHKATTSLHVERERLLTNLIDPATGDQRSER